jgi:hypothetical protein
MGYSATLPVDAPDQGMEVLGRSSLRLAYNDTLLVNSLDRGLMIVCRRQLEISFSDSIVDSRLLPRLRVNIA